MECDTFLKKSLAFYWWGSRPVVMCDMSMLLRRTTGGWYCTRAPKSEKLAELKSTHKLYFWFEAQPHLDEMDVGGHIKYSYYTYQQKGALVLSEGKRDRGSSTPGVYLCMCLSIWISF